MLDVVNLRAMFDPFVPTEGSLEEPLTVLADLQRQGLIRHIGLSNVTEKQIADGRGIAEIVCVQNHYNLVHRRDGGLIDRLAADGIAYVPFFPLGGFSPLQSSTLSAVATRLGATAMQVALAWLLHRAPNILLIPGTSSTAHLAENLAVAGVSGTLERRLNLRPTRGRVIAKTGTTSVACALAGFVGKRYAFAILQNGSPLPYWTARTAQDRFVTVLARS